jgi:anaerobic sulfite reductase subunit B
MRGPYGNGFDVNLFEDKEILVVAGGSAVAPVRGIMNHYYDNIDKCEKFNLIAGFRSPDDVLFKSDFQRWNDKLNVILTVDRAEEDYKGNVGLVTKYIPELPVRDIDNVVAIVVGPPMMMKFTIQEFLKKGIKEENIWVSYERKMCCGIGKCGHCKMDETYICLEGPVFNYTFAKNLMD